MVSATAGPRTRGFNCANCGGAVELRALTHTRMVTCTTCGAILDPRDPNLVILQRAQHNESITPRIPLASRGTWHGHPYEVIGFQRRFITVEGVEYSWDEYVLFNPYRGFRYLSEYDGHWNDITPIRELPRLESGERPEATYGGRTYKHFQGAIARTSYVLGEFPWRVRFGDDVETDDFIAPPYMLSRETTEGETTWSLGEYTPARRIWQAFGVAGDPPEPVGIFANQPNPHEGSSSFVVLAFLALVGLLLVLGVGRWITADREQVFSGGFTFQPGAGESSFVTRPFTLRDAGTLDIAINTDLMNNWIAFDIAIVDVGTGTAYNVDKDVEFFAGVEGGEGWTEGSRQAGIFVPSLPAGEYYLRVEPSGPERGAPVKYTLRVRRDVPSLLPYAAGFVLLLIPLVWSLGRSGSFEHRRMQESDHGE